MVDARPAGDSGAALRLRRLDRHRALRRLSGARHVGAQPSMRQAAPALRSDPQRRRRWPWLRLAGSSLTASIGQRLEQPANSSPLRFRRLTSFWSTSITSTRFTASPWSNRCSAFPSYVLGVGRRCRHSRRAGVAAWRHRHLGGAILQRWQSGNLRSYAAMAGSRSCRVAVVCAGSLDHGAGWLFRSSPWNGGALRDEH